MGTRNENRGIPPELRIAFEKDTNFKDFFAEGAFGGVTPSGMIRFMLYCDQAPDPIALHHRVDDDGSLGSELEDQREMPDGFVRLLKAGVTMTPPAAEALARWLQGKVDLLKQQANEGVDDDDSIS